MSEKSPRAEYFAKAQKASTKIYWASPGEKERLMERAGEEGAATFSSWIRKIVGVHLEGGVSGEVLAKANAKLSELTHENHNLKKELAKKDAAVQSLMERSFQSMDSLDRLTKQVERLGLGEAAKP